jgi:cytosine/adenosine deaminase-related metal-dependent hydrolase
VQLQAAHREVLAGRPLKVTHCPSANLKLGSGIADLGLLRGSPEISVGIGTDGAPCNNDMDVLEELRLAALLQGIKQGPGAFSGRDAFELATIDGAAAIGLADEIGSLEVGKAGDVVVLDLEAPATFGPVEVSVYDRIVYAAGRDAVRLVAVGGRVLLDDSGLQFAAQSEIMARATEAVTGVLRRL